MPAADPGGSRWPAMLSQVLPDPQSNQSMMWILGGVLALIIFLGSVATGALAVWALLDRLRGKRESVNIEGKVDTRRSEEGPSRTEFDMYVETLKDLRDERKEDAKEIKSTLKEIDEKIDEFSSDQYKARGRMHHRMNTLENAMHFWAGKLAGQGDKDAEKLRDILDHQQREDQQS